jgi:hypothetical protein
MTILISNWMAMMEPVVGAGCRALATAGPKQPEAAVHCSAVRRSPAQVHLVRQLFEAMGMKAWVTQACRDNGVDAVATNEDPIFGGLCIIQAKQYRSAVGVEPVRALAG